MNITILEEAEQDLLIGFQFYEQQSSGLGQYFLNSLMADIDSLYLYAGVHFQQFNKHRMLAKRFPFGIYYTIESTAEVRVHAVLDLRQNPASIRDRMSR